MLYNNPTVLEYLEENHGKLIHLYGEPDAGRTQTIFSILNHVTSQDKIGCYLIQDKNEFRHNVFEETVWNKGYCIIGFPGNEKELALFMDLAEGTELVCVDNFLTYILHKPKKKIQEIFAMLSATAYKYNTNFVLVNDLRYLEAKGGSHPAYQEYFRHFCATHICVEKDSDFNIHYAFNVA